LVAECWLPTRVSVGENLVLVSVAAGVGICPDPCRLLVAWKLHWSLDPGDVRSVATDGLLPLQLSCDHPNKVADWCVGALWCLSKLGLDV
jgi:hypothetical protein